MGEKSMAMLAEKINGLDLSSIMASLQQETGMEAEMATRAEELYRQYLILRAKYPGETIVPPKLADEVWHRHILASEQYTHDCEEIFGSYLHHHQGEEASEELKQGWNNAKELYKQEFGVDVEPFAMGICT